MEPILLKIPFDAGTASTGFGDKPWTSYDMLVVRVETDAGIVGWGESWGYGVIPAVKTAIEQVVAAHFIGCDPTSVGDLREIWHKLHLFGRNGAIVYAMAGIEIALWDICGKAVRQPVHTLLGSAQRLKFPAIRLDDRRPGGNDESPGRTGPGHRARPRADEEIPRGLMSRGSGAASNCSDLVSFAMTLSALRARVAQ